MESFDISQYPEVARLVGAAVDKQVRRGALSAAHKLVSHIKSSVIPSTANEVVGGRTPVDRGLYRAAWVAQKTDRGADVYNSLPYAPIVEWGARAENIKIGKRMIDALTDWARRKGLVAKRVAVAGKAATGEGGDFTRVRWRGRTNVEMAEAARAVAWAIAIAMKKRGIFAGGQGLRVLERARQKLPQFLQEEIAREIARG